MWLIYVHDMLVEAIVYGDTTRFLTVLLPYIILLGFLGIVYQFDKGK